MFTQGTIAEVDILRLSDTIIVDIVKRVNMGNIHINASGNLVVPKEPVINFIEGDGIGKDIWPNAQRVFDVAIARAYGDARKIRWNKILAGEEAFEKTGSWLPEESLESMREHPVTIKGPLGTPTGGGHRSLNVTMRQELDLYACVRPVTYFEGVPSPVKHPEDVNLTIFRENTEDIYAGIEWNADSPAAKSIIEWMQRELGVKNIRFPETSSIGIKPISVEGTERLVRAAVEYGLKRNVPVTTVTIVHKGNIQKFTEGGFLRWGREMIEREYADELASGRLVVDDIIADNFLQQILLNPKRFDIVALTNLNGDYASDAVAAQVGGIGIAPGANINYVTGHAIFEATHGTAPDIAGKNLANPCSVLLSGVELLHYIRFDDAAYMILNAIRRCLKEGVLTGDFTRLIGNVEPVGTKEFCDEVIDRLL